MRLPFLSSGHAIDKYRHGDRPFALVTGASAGIGRALAFELAALNYNVIIHGRSKSKLETVQREVLARHPEITVVSLVQDAAERVDWPHVIKQIEELNVTILINNVGASTPLPFNAFECGTDEQIEIVMRVNAIFPIQLTRNLLPILIQNAPSLILNITSAATLVPPPMLAVYCGTKASNLVWSQALSNELRLLKRNVTCKAVMTGPVQSDGYNRPASFFIPTAEVYAKSLLARANASGPVYAGWWRHSLQLSAAKLMKYLPSFVLDSVLADVTRDILEWRQREGDETAMKPL